MCALTNHLFLCNLFHHKSKNSFISLLETIKILNIVFQEGQVE